MAEKPKPKRFVGKKKAEQQSNSQNVQEIEDSLQVGNKRFLSFIPFPILFFLFIQKKKI